MPNSSSHPLIAHLTALPSAIDHGSRAPVVAWLNTLLPSLRDIPLTASDQEIIEDLLPSLSDRRWWNLLALSALGPHPQLLSLFQSDIHTRLNTWSEEGAAAIQKQWSTHLDPQCLVGSWASVLIAGVASRSAAQTSAVQSALFKALLQSQTATPAIDFWRALCTHTPSTDQSSAAVLTRCAAELKSAPDIDPAKLAFYAIIHGHSSWALATIAEVSEQVSAKSLRPWVTAACAVDDVNSLSHLLTLCPPLEVHHLIMIAWDKTTPDLFNMFRSRLPPECVCHVLVSAIAAQGSDFHLRSQPHQANLLIDMAHAVAKHTPEKMPHMVRAALLVRHLPDQVISAIMSAASLQQRQQVLSDVLDQTATAPPPGEQMARLLAFLPDFDVELALGKIPEWEQSAWAVSWRIKRALHAAVAIDPTPKADPIDRKM